MMIIRWLKKTRAGWIVVTLIALVVAGALFALSGVYNVAASSGHFSWTKKLLEVGMHRSVATYSLFVGEPPRLDNPALVRLGAGHFHGGCAPCHGAPGERSNPIVDKMLPPPPALTNVAKEWTAEQLFWIVKHGIKYTGMPAWITLERGDEVWAVVAFLRALPKMEAAEYQTIVRSRDAAPDRSASERARLGGDGAAISVCARCHGAESLAPLSDLVPVLAGQSKAYLEEALRQYADGRRQSGFMQPAASGLDKDVITQLAAYYSALPASQASVTVAPKEQIQRGQQLATLGMPEKGVPACFTCHAGNTPMFPTLAGQHAAYLENQLRLWQRGGRDTTGYGAIMSPIAKRLSEQQIRDVAAFFESSGVAGSAQRRNSGDGK